MTLLEKCNILQRYYDYNIKYSCRQQWRVPPQHSNHYKIDMTLTCISYMYTTLDR